jgi:F0F1-type ATP synthase assembly protein I
MAQNGMDAPPAAGAAARWLDYRNLTPLKLALLVTAGFLVGALAGWLTS